MGDVDFEPLPIDPLAPVTLRGSLRSVSVDVFAQPGVTAVECRADSPSMSSEDIADRVRVWAEGNTVFVDAVRRSTLFSFGRGLRLYLTVPEGVEVAVESESGSVNLAGKFGGVNLRASSGTAQIDRAKSVTLQSQSGSVKVNETGDSWVRVSSGSVRMGRIRGTMDLESSSGSVRVEGLEGNGRISARSGSVRVGDVLGELSVEARSGSVRIGCLYEGKLETFTASGSQKIGVAEGTAVLADLQAKHGAVRSDLEAADPVAYERTAEVLATSRAGSIKLVRAR